MSARLTFLTGSKAGQHYDLETEEITVGRLPDMTVQFLRIPRCYQRYLLNDYR